MAGGFGFAPLQRHVGQSDNVVLAGLTGASAGNYSIASGLSTQVQVTPKAVTYATQSGQSIYGDPLAAVRITLSGLVDGDQSPTTLLQLLQGGASVDPQNGRFGAGTYQAGVRIFGGDYVVAETGNDAGTYHIVPRSLGLSFDQFRTTYGDPIQIYSHNFLRGVLAGDELQVRPLYRNDVAPDAAKLTDRSSAGMYFLSLHGLEGAASSNYQVDSRLGTSLRLEIARREIAVTSSGKFSRVYGDELDLQGSVSGLLQGDDVQLFFGVRGSDGISRVPVGTHALESNLHGSSASNYFVRLPGELVVTPRPLELTLARSIVYGETEAGWLTGILAGDQVDLLTRIAQGETLAGIATHLAPVGNHAIAAMLGGSAGSNYSLDPGSATGLLRIDRRPLTYLLSNSRPSWVYGTAPLFPTALLGPTVNNDVVRAEVQAVGADGSIVQAFPRAHVGTYELRPLLSNSNYVAVPAEGFAGTLRITPAPIRTGGNQAFSVYGDALPTMPLAGLLPGDSGFATLSVTNPAAFNLAVPNLQRTGRINAGEWNARPALAGPDAGNYEFVGDPLVKLTVRPRDLTFQALDHKLSYGDRLALLMAGYSSVGNSIVGSMAAPDVLAGDSVSVRFNVDQAKRSGSGNLAAGIYSLGAPSLTDPSGGVWAQNYALTNTGVGTLTVSPQVIDVSAFGARGAAYGDEIRSRHTSTLQGDKAVLVEGVLQDGYFTPLGRLNAGTYREAYRLAGDDGQNYQLSGTAPDLTIFKRSVRLQLSAFGETLPGSAHYT
jgi:hypothetical protein